MRAPSDPNWLSWGGGGGGGGGTTLDNGGLALLGLGFGAYLKPAAYST